MSAELELEGRIAFITGAAHGQGRSIALKLAAAGADIAAFDVAAKIEYPGYGQGTPEELQSLKAEIEALGRRALVVAGDVRDAAAVNAAVAETVPETTRMAAATRATTARITLGAPLSWGRDSIERRAPGVRRM